MFRFVFGVLICLFMFTANTAGKVTSEWQSLLDNAAYDEVLAAVKIEREAGHDDIDLAIYAAKAYDKIIRRSNSLKRFRLTKKMKAELQHVLVLQADNTFALEELADFYYYAPAIGGGSKNKSQEFGARLKAVDLVRYHMMEGRHAHDDGNMKRAVQMFVTANELAPDEAEVMSGLANVYGYNKQYRKSFDLYGELLEQEDPDPDLYYGAARSAQLGKFESEKAIKFLHIYLDRVRPSTDASKAAAHFRLGFFYKGAGKRALAKQHFEQAIVENPKLKQAKIALKEMDDD